MTNSNSPQEFSLKEIPGDDGLHDYEVSYTCLLICSVKKMGILLMNTGTQAYRRARHVSNAQYYG